MKRRASPLKHWFCLVALSPLAVLVACYTVPQTGRSAFNVMSPQEELRLGKSTFAEIKKKEKESKDERQIAMIQRVGKRIATVADQDIPNAQWEFVLFESKEPNAFALPGGKVGVYTGILPITQDDSGMAAVMGHEIAHAAARHGSERFSHQLTMAGLATGLGIGLSEEDRSTQELALLSFGLVTTLGHLLPHSRTQESEADRIGLIYMAKAGYPPKAAVEFWQRFMDYNQKQGGKPPAFLSTHPADAKRIADLEALLPEAEVYYKTSRKKS